MDEQAESIIVVDATAEIVSRISIRFSQRFFDIRSETASSDSRTENLEIRIDFGKFKRCFQECLG